MKWGQQSFSRVGDIHTGLQGYRALFHYKNIPGIGYTSPFIIEIRNIEWETRIGGCTNIHVYAGLLTGRAYPHRATGLQGSNIRVTGPVDF